MAWRHGDDKNDEYREGWRMMMMLIRKGRQDHPHQYSFLYATFYG